MKIQYKIVIPFTLLFVIATLVTALVSISLMSRNLEIRMETQLDQASRMIARADFALNSSILENLKTVIGADVVTYRSDGTILAATSMAQANAEFMALILDLQTQSAQGDEPDFAILDAEFNGTPYKIGYRRLPSPPETWVTVVADTSDLAATQNTIATSVLLIVGLIVLLGSFISHMIARSLTAPALRLVAFTKKVASGERKQKAEVGSTDEIGVLAEAFNEMMEQLRKSEEKLLQSEKLALTGLLAARVAHDVRNPLSAIKMHAQLLRSRLTGNESRELIQSMLKEIDRVEWVVRGMLDLSSLRELELHRESPQDILEDVLQTMGPQLRHRKIAIRQSYDTHVPSIMVDRNRFKLALLNLIMNASEAMPNGGTLDVSIQKSTDNDALTVDIADAGVGIDPSIRDRLFDPFVSTKREGVGLGLLNAKNIVERHGGTIQLLPRPGGGARAVITLPIDPEGKARREVTSGTGV